MIPHHVVDGSGVPVVLISSLGATLDMWRPQVAPLSDRFRLLRFDIRGHGLTRAEEGAWTIDDLAGDVVDLLESYYLQRAHLVGISFGGLVAMQLALRDPARVGRLVLVSTAPKFGTPESWAQRAATVRAEGCAVLSGAAMERWFTPAFRSAFPETVAAVRERFDACDAAGYAACCEAMGRTDLRGEVERISMPTLIVAGSDDEVTTVDDAEFMASRIAGSRMAVAAGAKHLLTVERADWFNRLLIDFLETGADQGIWQ